MVILTQLFLWNFKSKNNKVQIGYFDDQQNIEKAAITEGGASESHQIVLKNSTIKFISPKIVDSFSYYNNKKLKGETKAIIVILLKIKNNSMIRKKKGIAKRIIMTQIKEFSEIKQFAQILKMFCFVYINWFVVNLIKIPKFMR